MKPSSPTAAASWLATTSRSALAAPAVADPTFRLIGSRKIWERGAALTSRLQSFETEVLTQEENLAGLAALNRELIAKAEAIDSPRRVVLDMDSTEIPGKYDCSAPLRLRRLLTPRLRSSSTVMAEVVGPPPF